MIETHVMAHAAEGAGVLEPERLRSLVRALTDAPGAWAPRVRHDADERVTDLLWRDARVEVWLICWSGEDHDTGFHDHDESGGALAVARGTLVEERLAIAGSVRRRLTAGAALAFPPSHVHRLHGVGEAPAVSLHAYSPPLRRLGVYSVGDEGALRRETVPAAHELGVR